MDLDQYFNNFKPTKMGAPLNPMGDFPIAKASDILVEYDESKDEDERETRLPDALSNLGKMGTNNVDSLNLSSGYNKDTSIDENGISWNNTETEIYLKDGYLITTGASQHRVPLVAGEGIVFELDESKNVVRIKSTNTGGSTGGSTGGVAGIIDVDTELPTDNINENAIYRLKNYRADVYYATDGGLMDCRAYLGDPIYFTLPPKVVLSLPSTLAKGYVYVLKNTGIAYVDMGAGVKTLGNQCFGATNIDAGFLVETPKSGRVYSTIEFSKYTYHVCKDGKWTELLTDDTESKRTIQAVTTPEELDDILTSATDEDEGKTYMYVGTTGGGYKSGGVYRIERKELTNG